MRKYDLKYRFLCIFGNNAGTFAEADLQSPANFLAAESAVSWNNPWAAGRLLFCFLQSDLYMVMRIMRHRSGINS